MKSKEGPKVVENVFNGMTLGRVVDSSSTTGVFAIKVKRSMRLVRMGFFAEVGIAVRFTVWHCYYGEYSITS